MSSLLYPSETIIVSSRGNRSKGSIDESKNFDDEVSTLSDNSLHPQSRQRSATYEGAYPIKSRSKLQAYLYMKKYESIEISTHVANIMHLETDLSGSLQPGLVGDAKMKHEGLQRESNSQDGDLKSLPSRSSIDGDASSGDIQGQAFNMILDSIETQLNSKEADATNGKVNGQDMTSHVNSNESETQRQDRLRRLKKRNIYRQMMRQRRSRTRKNGEEAGVKPQSEDKHKMEDASNKCAALKVFQTTPHHYLKEALTRSYKFGSNPLSPNVKNGATDTTSNAFERIRGFREKCLANQAAISQQKLLSSPLSHTSNDTQTTASNTTNTSLSVSNKSSFDESPRDKISTTSFLKEWMEKVEKDYGVRPQKGSEVNEWDTQTKQYEKEILHRVMERAKAKVCVAPFPGIQATIQNNFKSKKDTIEDPPYLHRVSSTRLIKSGESEKQCEEDLGVNFGKDNAEFIGDLALNDSLSEFEHEIDNARVLISEDDTEDGCYSEDLSYCDAENIEKVKSINTNQSRLEQYLSYKGNTTIQSFSSLADSSGTDSDLSTTPSWESSKSEPVDDNSVNGEGSFCDIDNSNSEGNVIQKPRTKAHILNTFSEVDNEKVEMEYRRAQSFDNKWDSIYDPECTSFQLTRKIPRRFAGAEKRAPQQSCSGAHERWQNQPLLQKLQTVARKVWDPTQTGIPALVDTGINSVDEHDRDEDFLLGNCCSMHGRRYSHESFL